MELTSAEMFAARPATVEATSAETRARSAACWRATNCEPEAACETAPETSTVTIVTSASVVPSGSVSEKLPSSPAWASATALPCASSARTVAPDAAVPVTVRVEASQPVITGALACAVASASVFATVVVADASVELAVPGSENAAGLAA